MDSAQLYFGIFCSTFLLVIGAMLAVLGQFGWGLFSVGAMLLAVCAGSWLSARRAPAPIPVRYED